MTGHLSELLVLRGCRSAPRSAGVASPNDVQRQSTSHTAPWQFFGVIIPSSCESCSLFALTVGARLQTWVGGGEGGGP